MIKKLQYSLFMEGNKNGSELKYCLKLIHVFNYDNVMK